ncbi:StlD/DarB family beta-ketosynthase [Achromobacter sp. MFA1 R4]|uniref:StlD/DarB family beta-ketosynthase n=1 Tax=Achromobacter sp. MFA1 R4 TaxID=1881016 RepID=UPI000953768A|nr:StlD/DarB family beta-ketosynthase [Achromobacter sp. MFA1 R4]SIT20759.1 3-oxoacyl-[acyl-carrier-protein] synthase-3 [Achromobacter sp. MFA1 R4]
MPIAFHRVYLESAGYFMPGEPVSNEAMDSYIAPLNRMSSRIKSRILAENGIKQRYYAIDADGATVFSNAQLAANAIRDCLRRHDTDLSAVSLLTSGSSGGDALMPGFSNMIQGELAAPPMETLSVHGICAAGVSAIQAAAQGVELGAHASALAVASELPSRLFKRSRFAARGYDADFDAHFLRWMLSDGAGAVLLGNSGRPLAGASQGVRLRLKWVHQRSFSGDYPVCMQLGLSADRSKGHLDYPSWNEAEADGALSLRQDIRLLPHLFDIGIHEYAKLVRDGWVDPDQVDHFLCHYSSEKFIPVVEDLMEKAGLAIPRERWFSNLAWRGNTGAASILIMLAEFLETREVKPGEQIFCYIPESGRFMAAYMLLEAEAVHASASVAAAVPAAAARQDAASLDAEAIAPPHDPDMAPQGLGQLLTELASIWHDYRSRVWRTPVVRRLRERRFQTADYLTWMENWIPQVREGSKWMREGAASLSEQYAPLAALIDTHAGEEQNDFQILFQDYRTAGGTVDNIDALRRNPGGEALNAYLHGLAATRDPIGLLGAIYIIEGTGQRIVPALLPLLKASLTLPPDAFRFLEYHGHNDEHHLARWLTAVELVLDCDEDGRAAQRIVDTARRTAALYLMQFHHVMEADAA